MIAPTSRVAPTSRAKAAVDAPYLEVSSWDLTHQRRHAGRSFACASRSPHSALAAFAGFTSTAIRTALGTKSCRSRSRLVTTSRVKKLMPVALPPGRAAGDKTKPNWVFGDPEDLAEDRRGGA